jgi:4-hydroxy-tetrahydrodipicolinate synthase
VPAASPPHPIWSQIRCAPSTTRSTTPQTAAVDAAQARINAYRTLSNSYVQIPTIKAMVGLKTGNAAWKRTRAPLMPISDADYAALSEAYAKLP